MGHKITSLGMVAANFEPSHQIDKGAALPMPHVAGKVWMILGAIKFFFFFFFFFFQAGRTPCLFSPGNWFPLIFGTSFGVG
jgi:hypothetical protein